MIAPDPLIVAARRAAASHPGYRRLLEELGWAPHMGAAALPVIDKSAVFSGAGLAGFDHERPLPAGTDAFTSSGSGGVHSIGLSAPADARRLGAQVDALADQLGFAHPLVLSCLPQGIRVPSGRGVGACAGTHIEAAMTLIRALGARQGACIICAEPLLAKEIAERLEAEPLGCPIVFALGGEWPSEGLRAYLRARVGGARVLFSFGAAELGVGAFMESPDLAEARAWMYRNRPAARAALGLEAGEGIPGLYRWDPRALHPESLGCEGRLVVSALDERPLQLVRYALGDRALILDGRSLGALLGRAGYRGAIAPGPVLAHRGRLGAHAGEAERVKDWMFGHHERARALSGRFVVHHAGRGGLSLQLARDVRLQDAAAMLGMDAPGAPDRASRAPDDHPLADTRAPVRLYAHDRYRFHRDGHERKARYETAEPWC